MKVTIEEKSEELKFPCLMESPVGQVVLFTSATRGIRLTPKEGGTTEERHVGECSSDWVSVYAPSHWRPFNGRIVLENS